jgi:aminoglycoside phosphotransferase (APT) family kinase protein
VDSSRGYAIPIGRARDASGPTLPEDHRADCKRLLALVAPRLDEPERVRADQLVSEYLDDGKNWQFTPTVTHHDLGPEHVLVSPAGELVGVIDWEEVSTGDPAWDFAWSLHADPAIGNRILDAYGGAPDDRLRRELHAYALGPWHEVSTA